MLDRFSDWIANATYLRDYSKEDEEIAKILQEEEERKEAYKRYQASTGAGWEGSRVSGRVSGRERCIIS